jgi:DNA alkylation damage repair protein AlkB
MDDSNGGSAAAGSSGADAAPSSSPSPSADLYRPVEKLFKASSSATAPAAGLLGKRGRKQRRRSGCSSAAADEHAAHLGGIGGEAAFAVDMARWRADIIDCDTPDLRNNSDANRARIREPPWATTTEAQAKSSSGNGAPASSVAAAAAAAEPAVSCSSTTQSSPSRRPWRWLSPHARLYTMTDQPGFYLIRGALDVDAQAWLAWRALHNYSTRPHTNLTALQAQKDKELQQQQERLVAAATQAAAAASVAPAAAVAVAPVPAAPATPPSAARSVPTTPAAADRDLWQRAVSSGDLSLMNRLRWTSLGDIYDWSARVYLPVVDPFPSELAELAEEVAAAVAAATAASSSGSPSVDQGARCTPLRAEAALVNFYPSSACMGGHVDDAEKPEARHAPIVSVSLGCTGVFLIGGHTRAEKAPNAFYVRAGDVAVMAAESRMSVHGLPRVLDDTFGWDAQQQPPHQQLEQQQPQQPPPLQMPVQESTKQDGCAVPPARPGSASSNSDEERDEKKRRCDDNNGSGSISTQTTKPTAAVAPANGVAVATPAAATPKGCAVPQASAHPYVPWSAERCFAQLQASKLPSSSSASASSSADVCSSAASSSSSSFPPGLPHPMREELLPVFRFLRHARINLNVRQVRSDAEADALRGRAGMDGC